MAAPSVVYNLNLAHFLTTFSTIELTSRNTAFAVYVPATKAIVLVAGYKGFKIESFENFQLTIKNGKSIDISITTKDVDQILIVDGQDKLRFARIDEPIKLHSRATPFAHLFKNIVNQIIEKEEDILQQMYEIRNFGRTIPNNRKKRNIMEFFLGRSAGATFFTLTISSSYARLMDISHQGASAPHTHPPPPRRDLVHAASVELNTNHHPNKEINPVHLSTKIVDRFFILFYNLFI